MISPISPVAIGSPACERRQFQELRDQGAIQLTIFDQQDMAEITSDEYPDPNGWWSSQSVALAEERTRKRTELLDATDGELSEISAG